MLYISLFDQFYLLDLSEVCTGSIICSHVYIHRARAWTDINLVDICPSSISLRRDDDSYSAVHSVGDYVSGCAMGSSTVIVLTISGVAVFSFLMVYHDP